MRLLGDRESGVGNREAVVDSLASRARLRGILERVARAIALVVLGLLLIDAWRARPVARADRADAPTLDSALVRWSTVDPRAQVHVRIDGDISPAKRDWLSALRASGTAVSWQAIGALPVAAVADPIADPAGGTSILVAAPPGAMAELSDDYGALDSVRTVNAGARFVARSAPNAVRLRAGALMARSTARDSLGLGRVLVLGQVGWETKFVAAALEERGWRVDARMELGPKGDVVQVAPGLRGSSFSIDTARYSAVIALDSTAARYAAPIAAYVRAGGGLVATASVLRVPSFVTLGAGGVERLVDAVEPFVPDTLRPRRSLGLRPIALRPDAVPLEYRDAAVAVAARRVERGRVVAVGYEDTWRWRMGGDADAVDRHRDWWADLVARVAYTSRATRPVASPIDEAPYARLVESLGPPVTAGVDGPRTRTLPIALLFAVLTVMLLSEWASRRLRGAP